MDVRSIAAGLVQEIENDPMQVYYRQRPVSPGPIVGWDERLNHYFWPKPNYGFNKNELRLKKFVDQAAKLVAALDAGWSPTQRKQAIEFCHEVFCWGGIAPRTSKLVQHVEQVFRRALNPLDTCLQAPMSSGWSKVAAFATAARPLDQQLVILDSRVSRALLSRLDEWLVAHQKGRECLPQELQALGRIPGRGSAHSNACYRLNWPWAYGRWDSVLAASVLVRAMAEELNRQGVSAGKGREWSVREVEMVLFMEGYHYRGTN